MKMSHRLLAVVSLALCLLSLFAPSAEANVSITWTSPSANPPTNYAVGATVTYEGLVQWSWANDIIPTRVQVALNYWDGEDLIVLIDSELATLGTITDGLGQVDFASSGGIEAGQYNGETTIYYLEAKPSHKGIPYNNGGTTGYVSDLYLGTIG
jgi:hypothetical protein